LIRKGTPRDLAEANHLMKVLSGYDNKYKTDYRAKVAEEVDQLRRKADLLREMLLGVSEGETIGQGDVYEVISLPHYFYYLTEADDRIWLFRLELLRRGYRKWLKRRQTMPRQ
jgi:hypothetical protein